MNPSTRLSDSFRDKMNRPPTRALNLGYIYFKNGEFSEAENLARDSLASEKSDKGYRLLGEVLLAQNKHREALEAFSKSLELNPKQEFCLNKVCELIDPNPASVERLEFWAHQAARNGFIDISANFVKASEIAKQAGFPNDPTLTKVAKDIAQTENKTQQSFSFSCGSGRPSLNASSSSSKLEESMDCVNKSITQILDEVKQLTLVTRSQENELKELREEMKRLTVLVTPETKAKSASGHASQSKPGATPTPSTVSFTPSVPAPFPAAAPARIPVSAPMVPLSQAPTSSIITAAIPSVTTDTTKPPFPAPKLQFTPTTIAPVPQSNSFTSPAPNFFQDALKAQKSTNVGSNAPSLLLPKFGSPSPQAPSSAFGSSSILGSSTFGSSSVFGSSAGFGSTSTFGSTAFGSSTSSPSQLPSFPGFNTTPQPIFGAKPSPIFSKPQENADDDNNSDPEDDRVDVSKYKLPQLANLPAKVEIKTGEEDEEVVYSQRAKIFRYDKDAKEWKERGLGDLKILRHRETKKYRMLMRREQVHKIAINCYINNKTQINPKPNSENCAQFVALDYSDDEPAVSGFTVRFKTKELLKIFMEKVDEIVSILATGGDASPGKNSSSEGSSEVEIVFEKKPKPALIEEARKLLLPDSFFNHLDAEGCTGCRGCPDKDECDD